MGRIIPLNDTYRAGTFGAWPEKAGYVIVWSMKSKRNLALVALGLQIRTIRQARGISQENFAIETGFGRSYYGGVERGERNIAALNLMRIAAALEVEVGELFPKAAEFKGLLGAPSVEEV